MRKVLIGRRKTSVGGLLVCALLVGVVGVYVILQGRAATCTVSDKLVNSCRPWYGAFAGKYSEHASDTKSQILGHESRIGRQVDIAHTYHPAGNNTLNTADKYFAARSNTILMLNWKPSGTWKAASGGDAGVNAGIDQMAREVKSLAPKKIMFTLYHEPENDVTNEPSCPGLGYKGSLGTPADYRNMWANVQSRFKAAGVTNVVWVMNYMGFSQWDCLVKPLWPGNDRVDWVMWDPYSGSNSVSWQSAVSRYYNWLSQNSDASHNFLSKPWGLGEFGIGHGNTTVADQAHTYKFYDDAKASLAQGTFPKIKAYVNFDTQGVHDTQIAYATKTHEYDPVELQHYKAFAQDPRFTDAFYATSPPPPPADTTAPRASITAPTANATLSGNTAVSLTASDNVAVTKVAMLVDGAQVATDSAAPFGFTLNTTQFANGNHALQVKAYDAAGNTGTSSAITVNIRNLGAAPSISGISPVSGNMTGGTVVTVTGANFQAGATVQFGSKSGSATAVISGTSIRTTAPSGSGTVSVKVTNPDGQSAVAAQQYSYKDLTAPSVVQGLTSPSQTASSIALTWNASTDNVGVTGYRVSRNGVALTTVTTPQFTDTGLKAATTYSYTVIAVDAAGNASAASSPYLGTTKRAADTTAPSIPSGLRATSVTPTAVGLAWNASTDNVGVTGYYVQRNGVTLAQLSATTYTDTSAIPGTQYSYVVRSFDAAGNVSAASSILSIKTPAPADAIAPTAPSGVAARAISARQVNVSWNASTDNVGVTGYRVSRNGVAVATVSGATSFGDGTVISGTTYAYTVTAIDAAGNMSPVSAAAQVITPTEVGLNASGLWGTYFSNRELTGPSVTRIDQTVNFDWASTSPDTSLPGDNFGVRWTGRVLTKTAGQYTFYTKADDGMRLWVNDRLVIDDWSTSSAREKSATVTLAANTRYNIKFEYYEQTGLASAVLLWSGPSIAKQVIPASQLVTSSHGLFGTYYDNQDFTNVILGRTDSNVNFNWADGSPDDRLASDTYSVRWQGLLFPLHDETYTFYTTADDGVRVWVNDKLVIDDWSEHGARERQGTISLSARQKVPIVVEYYEAGGLSMAQLQWSSPSTPKAVIPSTLLFDR
jgi:chitodextrinase